MIRHSSHVCKAVESVISRPESNKLALAIQPLPKFTSGKKKIDLFHSDIGYHLETKYEVRIEIMRDNQK